MEYKMWLNRMLRAGKGQRGFTVAEVVLAAAIMVMTSMGVLGLFQGATQLSSTADRAKDAQRVARSVDENIRTLPFYLPNIPYSGTQRDFDDFYWGSRTPITTNIFATAPEVDYAGAVIDSKYQCKIKMIYVNDDLSEGTLKTTWGPGPVAPATGGSDKPVSSNNAPFRMIKYQIRVSWAARPGSGTTKSYTYIGLMTDTQFQANLSVAVVENKGTTDQKGTTYNLDDPPKCISAPHTKSTIEVQIKGTGFRDGKIITASLMKTDLDDIPVATLTRTDDNTLKGFVTLNSGWGGNGGPPPWSQRRDPGKWSAKVIVGTASAAAYDAFVVEFPQPIKSPDASTLLPKTGKDSQANLNIKANGHDILNLGTAAAPYTPHAGATIRLVKTDSPAEIIEAQSGTLSYTGDGYGAGSDSVTGRFDLREKQPGEYWVEVWNCRDRLAPGGGGDTCSPQSDHLKFTLTPGGATGTGLRGVDTPPSTPSVRLNGVDAFEEKVRLNAVDAFSVRLNAVNAFDANNVWAVGDNGTIQYTSNGGSTWVTQSSGTKETLRGVDAVSATVVWAVGDNGTIRYTSNGGTTWSSQDTTATRNLNDVSAVSSTDVWAVGWDPSTSMGVVLRYSTSWSLMTGTPYESYAKVCVAAVDSTNVWIVDSDGWIYKWNGSSWATKWSSPPGALYDISAASTTYLQAVGAAGTICRTTNGSTWAHTHNADQNLNAVSAASTTHVWTVGNNGRIACTINGGTDWAYQTSPTTVTLRGVSAANSTNVWAVGDNGTILFYNGSAWSTQQSLTTPRAWAVGDEGTILFYNGSTWAAQTSNTTQNLKGVDAVSASVVWAVGDGGTILYTSNGGSTWVTQTCPITTLNLKDVSAVDSTNVWAVGWNPSGSNGKLLYYGGSSWSDKASLTDYSWDCVSAVDSTNAWMVDQRGWIYKWTGSSWSYKQQSNHELYDIFARSNGQVWAVGKDRMIRYTGDGGANWSVQWSAATGQHLYGVHRDPSNPSTRLWVVGANGTIGYYDGSSWVAQTSGTTVTLRGVSAANSTNVWAVGDNGTILFYNGSAWSAQSCPTCPTITRAWAVGDGGTILFYNGSTWAAQTSGTTQNLKGVDAVSATVVWAVGDNGTIRYTSNGGSTWSSQTCPTTPLNLKDVSAVDSTNVWAVGEDLLKSKGTAGRGQLLYCSGTSWSVKASPGYAWVCVSAVNSTNVWTVDEDGYIVKWYGPGTSDWGYKLSRYHALYDIFALDTSRVWAVGDNGMISRTTDGGTTWLHQTIATNHLYGVRALSTSTVWAVGGDGTIRYTSNGDVATPTWSTQGAGVTTATLRGVSVASSTKVWAVGDDGTILYTSNGGTNWSAQENPAQGSAAATRAWAVGDGGTIRYYDGSTWATQNSGTTQNLKGVDALSENVVWAVGDGGTILYTSNGGSTWVTQSSGTTTPNLYAVSAASSSWVWAVGVNPLEQRGEVLEFNGSWNLSAWLDLNPIVGVTAPATNRLWIVSRNTCIYYRFDGSWVGNPQYIADQPLNGVHAASTTHVWAVGDNGRICRTTDGSAWSTQTSNTTQDLYGVRALSTSIVWAVGVNGTIGCTVNGGANWSIQGAGATTENLYAVSAASSTKVWAVGDGGTILYTSNGGTNWSPQ